MSNSIFNLNTAQEATIVPDAPKNKEIIKIFDKYIASTLQKVEQSISDANGRYVEGKSYAQAKPSQNWKVVGKADSVQEEEVKVWLKIGVRKQSLFTTDNGGEVYETKIPSSRLIEVLTEMKTSLETIRDNPTSEAGKAFHQEAIDAAKPKSAPKDPTLNGWVYDAETDTYVAVP